MTAPRGWPERHATERNQILENLTEIGRIVSPLQRDGESVVRAAAGQGSGNWNSAAALTTASSRRGKTAQLKQENGRRWKKQNVNLLLLGNIHQAFGMGILRATISR